MPDIHQSRQYADYLSRIGWTVERINNTNYFIRKLLLIGSVLKIQRPGVLRYKDIEILNKKYKTFQIIVEPGTIADGQWLMANGFKLSISPYLPTKTLHLDLSVSKQKLFNNLKKDAKYAIKRTIKLRTKEIKNMEKFRNSWKKTVGWKRYVPPSTHLVALQKSFQENSLFILDEKINSGAIFLKTKDTVCYWQAFTGKEGRNNLVQYQIVWKGILWAKKKGAKIFDFEGIYDERFPNKSWFGFTHFKKSFGGYEIEYPGCYTKWLLPSK